MVVKRLVIPNRGEIACRITDTAKKLGYEVAILAPVNDQASLCCRKADAVLDIPSYLDIEAIIKSSVSWGASLLHPGYGFLSENAEFSKKVSQKMAFVGPSSESMRLLSSKLESKKIAIKSGVRTLDGIPIAPGSKVEIETLIASSKMTPPFLIKAAAGGGGRGMRIVKNISDLHEAIRQASLEAESTFGDGTVFVEPYLERARHIEVQVFGDGKGGGVALGERECSLQRRYQKVIEECPSLVLGREDREAICNAALAMVSASKYAGAGTVEFLWKDGFYFLEVNTRLQVEHPVTEEVFGIDLVQAQIELAEGNWPKSLPDPSKKLVLHPEKHAIELRVIAEDPSNNFSPSPGRISYLKWPEGARVDTGIETKDNIHPSYDPMIAKIIVSGSTRNEAIKRTRSVMLETVVHGIRTNLSFLNTIISHPDYVSGDVHTTWIEGHTKELHEALSPCPLETENLLSLAVEAFLGVHRGRLPHEQRFAREDLLKSPKRDGHDIIVDNKCYTLSLLSDEVFVSCLGNHWVLKNPLMTSLALETESGFKECLLADMSGQIIELFVSTGSVVFAGDCLLRFESMKMQTEICASFPAVVSEVHVEVGKVFSKNTKLITFTKEESDEIKS